MGPLREALDAFRASPGWPDFLSDVPPLDIDLGAVRGRLAQLSEFVGQVAAGFEAADTDPRSDDPIVVDDGRLASFVTISLASPVTLVRDGDRWIFPGTDGRDFVRVVTENGRTYLEVGVTYSGQDGRQHIRWERRELTDEQARNLVIRTGGEEDFIGISPGVAVAITVWSGAGNDVVGMPGRNYTSRLGGGGSDRVFTGAGNDRVEGGAGDDEVYAGDGDDYVDGQSGNDRVVGGAGHDVVYGGTGGDTVDGGDGDDHVEGGSDNDVVRGNGGRDIVSGGRGDDRLHGGAGDDDLFGGRGTDTVEGGDGNDKVTAEAHDRTTGNETWVRIELTGDPGAYAIDFGTKPDWMTDAEWQAWRERLDSDIEFLRTTHSGRQSLAALDQASRDSDGWAPWDGDKKVTIVPTMAWDGDSREARSLDQWLEASLNNERLPGESDALTGPVDSLTRFDRSYYDPGTYTVSYGHANARDFAFGPPPLVLQHELAHAYDGLYGGVSKADDSGWNPLDGEEDYTEIRRDAQGNELQRSDVPRDELNAMGIDTDRDGDIDTIDTEDGEDHPTYFTENALRDELRRPRRDSYTMGTQDQRQNGEHVTYENAD